MTSIIKKNDDTTLGFDPFRALRDWMRWDPFREMVPQLARPEIQSWMPAFEVSENKDGYLFKADLPGVKPEELDIKLTGNRLEFRGKRESEMESKTDTYFTCERTYGSFVRVFTLPEDTDLEHIRNSLKDGILTVVVPKRPEALAKKITVNTSTAKV